MLQENSVHQFANELANISKNSFATTQKLHIFHKSTYWKCITIKRWYIFRSSEGTVEGFTLNGWKYGCVYLSGASNPMLFDSNVSQIPLLTNWTHHNSLQNLSLLPILLSSTTSSLWPSARPCVQQQDLLFLLRLGQLFPMVLRSLTSLHRHCTISFMLNRSVVALANYSFNVWFCGVKVLS